MVGRVFGSKRRAGTRYTEVRLDGVKVSLGSRGMSVEAVRAKGRKERVESLGAYVDD